MRRQTAAANRQNSGSNSDNEKISKGCTFRLFINPGQEAFELSSTVISPATTTETTKGADILQTPLATKDNDDDNDDAEEKEEEKEHTMKKSDEEEEEDNMTTTTSDTEIPPENTPLLHSDDPSPVDLSGSCWSFTSPHWSLSSETLLEITYRPAWQGVPEYTRISYTRDCTRRMCGGGNGAGCCSSKDRQKHVDFSTFTFTTGDIEKVKQLESFKIRGIGLCRGLRVHLQVPKKGFPGVTPMPTANNNGAASEIQKGLEKQLNLSPDHIQRSRLHGHAVDSLDQDGGDFKDEGPIITFAMPLVKQEEHYGSPLLWKVEFPKSYPDLCLETITVLNGTLHESGTGTDDRIHHRKSANTPPPSLSPTHIYLHGWQSWTFAGSVRKGEPQPVSAMPSMFSQAFSWGGSPPPPQEWDRKIQYQSDMFTCITSHEVGDDDADDNRYKKKAVTMPSFRALDETGGPALVLGWLAQHEQFGVIQAERHTLTQDIQMHASCDAILWKNPGVCTDWSFAQLVAPHEYDEEPMAQYLTVVAAHNIARPLQNGPLLTGWCSWYHYKEHITAAKLRENFSELRSLAKYIPTNVVVVDDGYMTAWGDWDSFKKRSTNTTTLISNSATMCFPHGMKGVAADVLASQTKEEQQMRPGIWLAPFACDKHSNLAKEKPDWVIRNNNGRVANSSNCGKFFCGLDATNPNVQEYVYACIRRAVQDWGYSVLKIDFLYAACLVGNGKYDLSITRAQAMHLGLQTIRAAAGPDVFLIGCGCPMGSGIGYVDGMRVTADTAESWYPLWPLPSWDNGTLPALRAMVRNSMTRACLGHRWWHNDPDCLLVGTTTKLTDIEVMTAASVVAMTCGMFLLSDDLSQVPSSRLNIVTRIFPMTGATAVVLDTHCTKEGLPSLMRLWCTDRYHPIIRQEDMDLEGCGHNHEATLHGRYSSFSPDEGIPVASERKRSCIHVAKGLGTWTLLSVSNLLDKPVRAQVPWHALLPPPEKGWKNDYPNIGDHGPIQKSGFHVFGFWSGEYWWIPDPRYDNKNYHLTKHLEAHETEIFHIKAVQPSKPAYLGSSIHFSCGYEVSSYEANDQMMTIQMRSTLYRVGHIYLYIPRPKLDEIKIYVSGKEKRWEAVGNTPQAEDNSKCIGRVIRVAISIQGDGTDEDGKVEVKF